VVRRSNLVIVLRVRAAMLVLLVCAFVLPLAYRATPGNAASTPIALPLCKELDTPKDLLKGAAPGLAVVEQGYQCILRHYITGRTIDDRVLLRGAFHEITQSLPSDLTVFTLPPLVGDRDVDWQLFADTYSTIAQLLPQTETIQQALAELALFGMTQSLNDDHLSYWPQDETKDYLAELSPTTPAPTVGIVTSPATTSATSIFITDVLPGAPASAAGLRPGDVIEQINGQPVIVHGQETSALSALTTPTLGTPITVVVQRPASGARLTVTLQAKSMVAQPVTARELASGIAYIKLFAFTSNAADRVMAALKSLRLGSSLRGIILDLRGNAGGAEDQAIQIVSAFAHHGVVGYRVQGNGKRVALHTDDSVTLLHTSLAVLTDGDSASSSELVAGAVRDLHLGVIVGSRTAGELASAYFYSLSDGSALEITQSHILGALGERVDEIGITPNQQVTATAADLSRGDDPVIDRAVEDILQNRT